MKKLIVLAFAAILCLACSTEEEITPNEGSNLEVVLENYKGIFTSTNGQYRGILDVTLSEDNRSATADLTLSTGEVISIFTDQVSDLGNVREMTFSSDELSFTMTTGAEEEILEIETVSFRGTESSILASKNTERAPVTPLSGTFACPGCPAPLNNSTTQTFNFMFTMANGNSAISTQTTLNTTTYNGIGVQFSCVDGGSGQTSCTINSGDGETTGVAFNAGGGNVGWIGTHTFDNGPSSSSDCSGVSGSWGWNSPILGNIGGSFTSDNACPPPATTLVFEDFEDSMVTYVPRNVATGAVLPEDISEIIDEDYFGRAALADFDPADIVGFTNIQGTRFFAAGDIDGINSPSPLNGLQQASLNWEGIDTTGLSDITVSAFFAEANSETSTGATPESWDLDTSVRIEYSFNAGATWTSVFAIESSGMPTPTAGFPLVDTNLNGTGNGAEITAAFTEYEATFTVTGPTMSVRIIMAELDAADEDIAFDNFTITGN